MSKKKSDDDLDEVQDEYIEDEVTGSLDPDDATGEISVTNLSKEEELDELEDAMELFCICVLLAEAN